MEAGGQHVDQEPADELVRVERHRAKACPAVAVILVAEGHTALVEADQLFEMATR